MAFITFANDPGYYVGTTKNLLGANLNTSTNNIIFIWKSLLKTVGWTVPASWASGDPNRTLSTDVHSASFNGWFAIKHPTSNRTFLVTGSGTGGIKILYSYYGFNYTPTGPGLPSSSLAPSSGAPTVVTWPSGSDSAGARGQDGVYLMGSGLNYTAGTFETFNAVGLTIPTCYAQIVAENQEPYRFWVSTYSTGSAITLPGTFLFLDKPEDDTYVADDIDPYVFGFIKRVTTNGQTPLDPYSMANNQPLGTAATSRLPFPGFSIATERNGVPDGFFAPTGLMSYTQNRDGTGWVRTVAPGSQIINPFGLNFNLYETSQSLDLFTLPWAIGSNFLGNNNTMYSAFGYKGASSMILGTSTATVANGTTLDVAASGSRDWISIGSYALPWDGSEASGSSVVQSIRAKIRFPIDLWKIRGNNNNSWFTGGFALEQPLDNFVTGSIVPVVYLYRGVLSGSYVYSEGTPPIGATDIVIIGKV